MFRYRQGQHGSGIVVARRAARSVLHGATGYSATASAEGTGARAHVVVTKNATAHTALVRKHDAQLQLIQQLKVQSRMLFRRGTSDM